jgi:(1->4)-alpha-D-glucan 1-alpha-D-glucosylmutase
MAQGPDQLTNPDVRIDFVTETTPSPAALARQTADAMTAGPPPRATYRVQLNHTFTFDDATAIVPWLARLGVSHFYASPIFKAAPGSMHGYDVVDFGEINPEMGGREAFDLLVGAVHAHGMKMIVDFVPNHMGIEEGANAWWQDVLEHGPASPYESYFDIDWTPLTDELRNKVLLPLLGDQYGVVLERGELRLRFDGGAFTVWYWDTPLPINPATYPLVLRPVLDRLATELDADDPDLLELESIITALERLPQLAQSTDPGALDARYREQLVAKRRLGELADRSAQLRAELDAELVAVNGEIGDPRSFDRLDRLLALQPWRVAFWKVAGEEINYRRFFAINTLAAIRQEEPLVFRATHRLLAELIAAGAVDAVRIDHPDGLWDPRGYFFDLQAEAIAARALAGQGVGPGEIFDESHAEEVEAVRAEARAQMVEGAEARQAWPLYVLAEKILEHGEALPEEWAIAGTVGYDFASAATAIFVDPGARQAFDRIVSRFTGDVVRFPDLVYRMKHQMMDEAFQSEVMVLTTALNRIAEQDRRYRDFTINNLRAVLEEVMACFPIYRTYTTCETEGVEDRDRRYITEAVVTARRRNPGLDPSLFDFLQDVLLLHISEEPGAVARFNRRCYFAMKFQQLSGPVMAKGLEDTAFYRQNRLVSLNEVGGDPSRFGISIEEFHRQNRQRLRRWPHAMINSSTHDTKRGEDVRARISALSHNPAAWRAAINRWSRLNRKLKRTIEGALAPHRADEYVIYQTLVGTWPLEGVRNADRAAYAERLQEYVIKVVREAGRFSNWTNPNEEYEEALRAFIGGLFNIRRSGRFLDDAEAYIESFMTTGLQHALGAQVLKLTSPGVPDIYQGTERWDDSLVDPDNRRPVDFDAIEALAGRYGSIEQAWANRQDGAVKVMVTRALLGLRAERPELFAEGDYVAVPVEEGSAVTYIRAREGEALLTVVGTGAEGLAGVRIALPERFRSLQWQDVLGDENAQVADDGLIVFDAAPDGLPVRVYLVWP